MDKKKLFPVLDEECIYTKERLQSWLDSEHKIKRNGKIYLFRVYVAERNKSDYCYDYSRIAPSFERWYDSIENIQRDVRYYKDVYDNYLQSGNFFLIFRMDYIVEFPERSKPQCLPYDLP